MAFSTPQAGQRLSLRVRLRPRPRPRPKPRPRPRPRLRLRLKLRLRPTSGFGGTLSPATAPKLAVKTGYGVMCPLNRLARQSAARVGDIGASHSAGQIATPVGGSGVLVSPSVSGRSRRHWRKPFSWPNSGPSRRQWRFGQPLRGCFFDRLPFPMFKLSSFAKHKCKPAARIPTREVSHENPCTSHVTLACRRWLR